VTIWFLDASFVEKTSVVAMDGTTPVNTVATDIFRVNAFRVTAGTSAKGNISLLNTAGTVTYSYITLGYTLARNSVYCVPAEKTLYVRHAGLGFGYAANQTHYARLWVRANQNTCCVKTTLFYPYAELIAQNGTVFADFTLPLKFTAGVDIQVGGIATVAGVATSVLRGWLV
jgi:hypothetical protein